MKKTKKNVRGNLKISSFFVKTETVKSNGNILNTENGAVCSITCNASTSKQLLVNESQTSSSLGGKRKADNIDTVHPPQKKSNIIFVRELTPERKPSTSEYDTSKAVISVKSPEQLLTPEALTEYYTPEKKVERFMDKIRTPTPRKILFGNDSIESPGCSYKKNDSLFSKIDKIKQKKEHLLKKSTPNKVFNSATKNSPIKSTEKTPDKGKKTPKKLFHKSPSNIDKFNVQVLENFVKITPSKTQKRDPDVEFISSSEKKQSSILKYISSAGSTKSVEAQNRNESTPTKESNTIPNALLTPATTKVKTKLDFSNCVNGNNSSTKNVNSKSQNSEICTISPKLNRNKKLNMLVVPPSSSTNKRNCTAEQENNLNITNTDFSFDNEWLEDIMAPSQLDYNLDLSVSRHCRIVKLERFPSKILITVKCTKSGEQAVCNLEGFWIHCHINVEDVIHISGEKVNDVEWIVNNDCGLLVYEPDLLISATSVVNTIWCKRKSVLTDCFRGFEPANEAMLIGSLVHSLLQHVLKNKIHCLEEIEKVAKNLIRSRSSISSIYDSGVTIEFIETELMKYTPRILSFMHLYVDGLTTTRQQNFKHNKEDWKGTIKTIDDIEENIWCPELGIKGKVDVSIKTDHHLMPLEVKTGRASVSLEHRGQVLMYIMMMNKLGYKVPSGLLLYLREGVLKEVSTTEKEKRDIIILRNELAYYLNRKPKIVDDEHSEKGLKLFPPELPEPINHKSCGKCPYNVICTVYAKYNNEDISSLTTLKDIQVNVLSLLEESHLNYFMHWVSLIALESNSDKGSKNLREIYTQLPEEREKNGKCIINLKVAHIGNECNGVFEHIFKKFEEQPGFSFFSHGIMESNYVVISTSKRPAVSAGFVTGITASSITVTLDRDLNKKYSNHIFCIDSYDSSSIQSYNLTSLTLLMELTERGEKLRRIIIDKTPPTFKSRLPKAIANKCKGILRRLNIVQQRAVLKAISANDYFLIEGMPGTGKTATIVALVQLLVELNKSVLITSHTHSAVDNVCLRLVHNGVKILRLGSETRIHPNLKEYSEYNLTKGCTTPEQLDEIYNSAQVLAVTCLGSGHPVLSKRVMDICIVDESTQVLQSSVIRPLHSAKTFILIGDPNQLPAVVRSREASEMGMSESLFERLYTPNATIALNLNYRMNKTITALANQFTYDGELLTGNASVANAKLQLPKKEKLISVSSHWITRVLDDSIENAVQFVNTGPVWKLQHVVPWQSHHISNVNEDNKNPNCVNIYEAALIFHTVKALLMAGVHCSNIGVIATFRAQVAQISLLLQKDNVDISTVDQFQGKDKNVIIYSCSKSRDTSIPKVNNKFELLEDKRRLTVAITRAKHKLIVVGDISTLLEYSTFNKILPYIESNLINLNEIPDFNWDKVLHDVQI